MPHTLHILALMALLYFANPASAREFEVASVLVPPYVMQEKSGAMSGIAVDLVNAASKRCALTPKYKILGWARALQTAEHGEVDAIMPLAHAPGRSDIFYFPKTPLFKFELSVFARRGDAQVFRGDLNALKGLTVGTLRNIVVSEQFEAAIHKGIFSRSKRDSYQALALGLSRKRLDVFVGDRRMGEWAISDMALQGTLETLQTPIRLQPVFLAFSKTVNNAPLAIAFNQCLQDELLSGTVKSLTTKYRYPPIHTANGK